jgi:tetratricopeptide (TPR) repeat protein
MPKISLCMIVKNEEANLAGCLRGVSGLFEEIVVVDTGSDDGTKQIAAEFGARLFDFPWCDDFSAARNESLRHARGEWAFWLDADDRVDDANATKLEHLFAMLAEPAAYYMTVVGDDSSMYQGIPQVRLFPLAPDVRWQYRIHEQIAPAVQRRGNPLRETDVVIRHTGYCSPEIMRAKWERNLRLLLLDVADYPNDPPTLFHLGMTYTLLARHAEAIPFLERALAPMGRHHREARFVLRYLVDSLRGTARPDLALKYCLQGLDWFPDDVYLEEMERSITGSQATMPLSQALEVARQYYEAGRLQRAEQQYRQVVAADPREVDALQLLGVIAGRTGRHELAVDHLRAALQIKPDLAAAHNNLGNVLVLMGRLPEAVDSFASAVRCKPDFAAAHSNFGNALRELGRLDEAIASLREAVRLSPDSAAARDNLRLALEAQERRQP